MREREHVLEIDQVLQGGTTGRDAIVAESWRRCVETHGLDPSRPTPAHIVTAQKLREHREQSERLIAIARSGLEALFRQVAGQNYVLLLADAKGVTVDFFGDRRFEDDLRKAGLYLGADWSENLAGTCGVGSCIVTQKAVTIHQGDHFDMNHTPLSCTAAPIFDTAGMLSAVLDISLLRSPQPKISQNLAMSLVRTSARRVEMANLMAMTRRDWVLRFSTVPEFLDVDPEAAIALDGNGRIIGMTHGARQMLGHPTDAARQSVLGLRLEDVMDLSVDDLPELMRGRPTEDRVIRLHDGRALFGHAISPQSTRTVARTAEPVLPGTLQSIGGNDPAIRRVQTEAARFAATKIPLLIRGETGTGKERLARGIHSCIPANRPFVVLNCASLSLENMEAALLGNGAGPGLVERADGGTLFLDEVADLPRDVQARLLRLLSEGETGRFRAERTAPLQLRLISATQTDLVERVRAGDFRADLFFRLAGATIGLPPLRFRQDFDWILDRLLRQRVQGGLDAPLISPSARAELKARSWPGNIRELMHTLDAAASLSQGALIDLPDLPAPAMTSAEQAADADQEFEALLAACDWNMSCAARRMGVNRSTVLRRITRMGLARE